MYECMRGVWVLGGKSQDFDFPPASDPDVFCSHIICMLLVTLTRLIHSPCATQIAWVRRHTMPSTVLKCKDVRTRDECVLQSSEHLLLHLRHRCVLLLLSPAVPRSVSRWFYVKRKGGLICIPPPHPGGERAPFTSSDSSILRVLIELFEISL